MPDFPKFQTIHERAISNKGGKAALAALLPENKSGAQLRRLGDDRYLAEMTRRIFCSGFVWRVIENKWPGFERAFVGFDPAIIAAWPDEQLDSLMKDSSIVRNYRKIASVRENAWFTLEVAREHGSFGRFIADWPAQDIIGLWAYLKQHGSRLGGNSGPYFLRFVGKDSFLLSADVCACLVSHGVIDKHNPSSKRDLQKIQDCFNHWQDETGLPLAQLSRIVACSVG